MMVENSPIWIRAGGQDYFTRIIHSEIKYNCSYFDITLLSGTEPSDKGIYAWMIGIFPATDKISKAIPSGNQYLLTRLRYKELGMAFLLCRPKPPKGKSHKVFFTFYVLDM